MTALAPRLLACPFCGSDAEMDTDQSFRAFVSGRFESSVAIYCTKCCVQMQHCYSDHRGTEREDLAADLIERWNTREAALTAAPAADGWMPIAEAPKDGTLFLCWVSAERWSQEDGEGSGRSADTSEVDFGQWRHFETGGAFVNMMDQIGDMQDITHWMPLPAAPSAKGVAK